MFVYPASLDWRLTASRLGVVGKPRVYVIRNAVLATDHVAVSQAAPVEQPAASRSSMSRE